MFLFKLMTADEMRIRYCSSDVCSSYLASVVCEKFQLGVAVHSSGELGIQLATMLHLGATIPNLTFSADAHYHHLQGYIIKGGKMRYVGGAISVPTGPGQGVELERDKMME